ncbi:ATP-binding protein [Streptomyces sparsogenes]|uniref:ATP-binding protein n=1 Tax=Streptomyces sparsogenes TaxID=67365 RepID=UPI0033FC16BB
MIPAPLSPRSARAGVRPAACRLPLLHEPNPGARARAAARELLAAAGLSTSPDAALRDTADSAVLTVSELVTNAGRHGGGAVELRMGWDGRALTIEVDDRGDTLPGVVPESRRGACGGYGLSLVDNLAEYWGAVRRPFGKTVHARLVRAADTASDTAADPVPEPAAADPARTL